MKKIFTNLSLLAALLVSVGASAQVFYTEDFASGMPAGWKTTDPSGNNVLWKYCAVVDTLCTNLYGHPAPLTASVANGVMISDSDEPGQLTTNHKSTLTSAAINCSGKPKVFLLMDMLFMVYSTNSTAKFRVSNDSTNWTDVTIPYVLNDFTDVAGNADHVTDNPYKPVLNLSAVAANKPKVWLQWEFDGNFDFWWFLDDVKLTTIDPTPAVNMKISSSFYPLTHYKTPIFAIEKDSFGFSCNVTNAGSDDQTALIVKASVTNSTTGAVIYADSLITNGLAAGVDSQFAQSKLFAPKLSGGKYKINYNVYVPGTVDSNPADNSVSIPFEVSTDGSWAREYGPNTGTANMTFTRPATVGADGWAPVSLFHFLGGTNDQYHVRDVEWRAGKTGGMTDQVANIYFLEVNDDVVDAQWNGFDPVGLPIDDNNSYTWIGNLTYEYLDTTTGNTPRIRYPINRWPEDLPGIDIKQGKRYLVAVSWEGASSDVSHGFATNVPYTNINTFIYNSPTWFGGFSGGEYTAWTRLYVFLGSALGTFEDTPLAADALQLSPVPATDRIDLGIKFDKMTSVTITLAMMNGQVLSIEDKMIANETVSYDVSTLEAGIYIARIATPEGAMTKQFTVVH